LKKALVGLIASVMLVAGMGVAFAHNYPWAHHVDNGLHKYQVTLYCPDPITEDSAANPTLTNYDPGVAIVYKCSTP
jgi:hypothetical protein